MVAVEGFPSVRGYQTQQGQIGASLECRVSFIKLLSAKSTGTDNVQDTDTPPAENSGSTKENDTFLDDISKDNYPF